MRHTASLNEHKARWESNKRIVFVEGQNAFLLRGKSATLAGRPNLVVLDECDANIIDFKTGLEQPWHRVQVMMYQHALPLASPAASERQGRRRSCVVYPHDDPEGSFAQAVHRRARGAVPTVICRHVAQEDSERTGMTVLRHQHQRLS